MLKDHLILIINSFLSLLILSFIIFSIAIIGLWFLFVYIGLIAVIFILISYKQDKTIPYIAPVLKKQYFWTKFVITSTTKKINKEKESQAIYEAQNIIFKNYLKIIRFLIILFKSAKDSFEIIYAGEKKVGKLFQDHKQTKKKVTTASVASLSSLILITSILSALLSLSPEKSKTLAAPLANSSTDVSMVSWYDGATFTDQTTQAADINVDDVNLVGSSTGQSIYLGSETEFGQVEFDISTPSSGDGTYSVSYVSSTTNNWESLTVTNNTSNFTTDGTITFTIPTDWKKTWRNNAVASSTAAGWSHSLFLFSDGTVWASGYNSSGQLGDGTNIERNIPIQINLSNIVAVSAGQYFSLALKSDGTVWAWGENSYGQLGDGTSTNTNTPVQASGLSGVIAIDAGISHSLALKSDGTVWLWGAGQMSPAQVSGLSNVIAISGGYGHSMALKSDGTVWTWGDNSYGQLGDGTNTSTSTPIQISGLTNIIAISGNSHSLALKSDGTVWSWGANYYGELGNGTYTNTNMPAQISGLTDVSAITAGSYFSLALKSDSTVWAWGANNYGQSNFYNGSIIPTVINELSGVSGIAAGAAHSLAIKSDGTVWSWGLNERGQLGNGSNSISPYTIIKGFNYWLKISTDTAYTTPALASQISLTSYNLRIKVQREIDSAPVVGLTQSNFTFSGCADTNIYNFREVGSGVYDLALKSGQNCVYQVSGSGYAPNPYETRYTNELSSSLNDLTGYPYDVYFGLKVQLRGEDGSTINPVIKTFRGNAPDIDFSSDGYQYMAWADTAGAGGSLSIQEDGYVPAEVTNPGLSDITTNQNSQIYLGIYFNNPVVISPITENINMAGLQPSNRVFVKNEANTSFGDATVSTGDGYSINCSWDVYSSSYSCPIPLSHTSTDIQVYKDGYGTTTASFASDRTNSSDPQVVATVIINYYPTTPTFSSPADNYSTSVIPTLSAVFSDPDINSPANTGKINFQVATDSTFTNVVASGSSSTGLTSGQVGTYTPSFTMEAGTTYYWRAQNQDTIGLTSSWSSYRSFTYPCTHDYCESFSTANYKDITNTTASWQTSNGIITQSGGNLVSFWAMDNDWTDVIGSNNGVAYGNATFGEAKYGSASGDFDQNNSYIEASITEQLTAYTIEAWFYPRSLSGWQGIVADNYWGCHNILLYNDKIDTYANGGALSSETISLNTWYYVALAHDGTNQYLYINGQLDPNFPVNYPIEDCDGGLQGSVRIGSDSWDEHFYGLVDEVAIYNEALSANTIAEHYSSGQRISFGSGSIAQSIKLNTSTANITKATLTKGGSGTATYYLSNNGGTTWAEVTPGVEHTFSTTGNDIRWKADISSGTITYINIDWTEAVIVSTPPVVTPPPAAIPLSFLPPATTPPAPEVAPTPDPIPSAPESQSPETTPTPETIPAPEVVPTPPPAEEVITETPVVESEPIPEESVTEIPVTEEPVSTETPTVEDIVVPVNEPAPSETTITSGYDFIPPAVTETVSQVATVIVDSVTQTVEAMADVIAKPIVMVNKQIAEIREIEEVVTATKEVASPVTEAVAIAVSTVTITAIATSAMGAQAVSAVAQASVHISEFLKLSALLSGLGIRRRRPWGKVYNLYTGSPVAGAQVFLVRKQFDKLVDTQITDKDGRFSFLVSATPDGKEHDHYIKVAHEGYAFKSDGELAPNTYHGQIIKTGDILKGLLNLNIPLVPQAGYEEKQDKEVTLKAGFIKVINAIQFFFNSINTYILIIGLALSMVVTAIVPSYTNKVVLIVYLLMSVIKMYFSLVTGKSFGVIKDSKDEHPLDLTAVRVFDAQKNILLSSRVTGNTGKFNFLLPAGLYYLTATRSGYKPYHSGTVDFKKSSIVSLDVKMEKG